MNDIYYGPGSGCKDQIIWVVQVHRGSIFLGWWNTSWPIALAFQNFCRCSRRISPVIWSSHVCVQGNIGPRTNYKNLLDQKYTRENYGTEHKTVLLRVFKKRAKTSKIMRIRGIELRSVPWEGTMIPLHQMRFRVDGDCIMHPGSSGLRTASAALPKFDLANFFEQPQTR